MNAVAGALPLHHWRMLQPRQIDRAEAEIMQDAALHPAVSFYILAAVIIVLPSFRPASIRFLFSVFICAGNML